MWKWLTLLNPRLSSITRTRLLHSSLFSSRHLPSSCQFYCRVDKQMTCMFHVYHALLDFRCKSILYSHKAILDYLHSAGLTKSFEQLREDTKLVRLISLPIGANSDPWDTD